MSQRAQNTMRPVKFYRCGPGVRVYRSNLSTITTMHPSQILYRVHKYVVFYKGRSSFLIYPNPTAVSQATYGYLPLLCSPCVTYRILCHAIGHPVLPTQPLPREAEDFPRGDKHFKHVPPLTYLICLSPKELYVVGLI